MLIPIADYLVRVGGRALAWARRAQEITAAAQDGSVDLTFAIRRYTRLTDGSQTIRAGGRHRGRYVALEVALDPDWESISLGDDMPRAFRGSVEIRSVGKASDALLRAMDRIYDTFELPLSMKAATRFTGITLGGDPAEPQVAPVKIKLFFEPPPGAVVISEDEEKEPEGYAELYVNIDLAQRKVEVREKDPEYRKPVILALAASGER